jgi:UDP-glucuronate 4-epimerase
VTAPWAPGEPSGGSLVCEDAAVRALVTGAAGFIGSHLVDALVADGHQVVGLDAFTPYYDRAEKEANLASVAGCDRFTLHERDLRATDLDPLVAEVDVVFHQAGQPGVRLSWHDDFATYVDHNVVATQHLLEALWRRPGARLVYASSSSVYGNAPRYPTRESDLPRPHSPYGVTKLAGEHLCRLYGANWGLPVVVLRYFTVYGPRQRPDMAIRRFVEAALTGTPVPVHGDGEQVRDFTYVSDVVAANLAAADTPDAPDEPINVAGGGATSVNRLLDLIGELVGRPVRRHEQPPQAGDVDRTGGSVELAAEVLGWKPEVPLDEGIRRQIAWTRAHRA